MSWEIEQELKNIRSAERGYYSYPFGTRRTMAVCYANTYEVAMSNLGFQIVYDIVNKRNDWQCERAFLPDGKLAGLYEKSNTPLLTVENRNCWHAVGSRFLRPNEGKTSRWLLWVGR